MQLSVRGRELIWKKIFFFAYFHIGAPYGLYLLLTSVQWKTVIWFLCVIHMSAHGTTVGAHRLWCHRSYKAKLPLRLLLAFYQTLSFQLSIYAWVRDHRLHHKYTDTEFDPHNSSKGFFYCHMGWFLVKKTPEVLKKGKELDLSDLETDPVVMFQKKYYRYLAPIIAVVFPAVVPWYFWNEPFWNSWYICNSFRYFLTIHATSLVNSAAHMWGNRPYDKNIRPTENRAVAHITLGEGWHNYHHIFPWDYKAAELGSYFGNTNTAFIDLMAKIGWAYDLKYASWDLVEKRANRTGDGTWSGDDKENVWGWGDKDMKEEDITMAEIVYQEESLKEEMRSL